MNYLEKRSLFPALISKSPHPQLGIVVVIPCYDEKELIPSLEALLKCNPPKCAVEVIVVINDSETESPAIKEQNEITFQQSQEWSRQYSSDSLCFHILYTPNLKRKIAGVGTARKIGMDEAVRRLETVGQSKGIISCFDADSLCESNYFQALEQHFENHPDTQACGIYFEHPLEGDQFSQEVYQAIAQYELHLRYYIHAQKNAGFPLAFQTIGSSMAVRCDAYQQQGGMNKRKAGEDFYFLHKFTELGVFSQIKTTKVIPSPRQSHRVPFGTGKAVNEIIMSSLDVARENQYDYLTYHPQTFDDLRVFIEAVPSLFTADANSVEKYMDQWPNSVTQFLQSQNFSTKLSEIQSNTTNLHTFTQRCFRWFNAFMLMKYVHFARDQFYPLVSVEKAAEQLLEQYYGWDHKKSTAVELLLKYRELDRKG